MTNFEKYKDEIFKIFTRTSQEVPGVINGKLVLCDDIRCSDCELDGNNGSCVQKFIKRLYEDDGEKQNSCDDCVHKEKSGNELPCVACSINYTNLFKRRPKKTRQDEFLEHYPNAKIDSNGALEVYPCAVENNLFCHGLPCGDCKKEYWLQEVE